MDQASGGPEGQAQAQVEAVSRDSGLQFDRVDETAQACVGCQQRIGSEYFEAAGRVICPRCAEPLRNAKSFGAFARALLCGGGAALLGTIAWFTIIKLTNREFGPLAIGIGLFVGVAVRKGSRGLGGPRYQALAIVLTYVSITASYVPLVIKELSKQGDAKHAAAGASGRATAAASAPASDPGDAERAAPPKAGSLLFALVVLLGFALAAPFLGGFDNIMGIIIIGIALYEAWKMNKGVPIRGPFRLAAPGAQVALSPA